MAAYIKEYKKVDFYLIICWLFLIVAGWFNIYSAVYSEEHSFILSLSQKYGLQFIWMIVSIAVGALILYTINPHIYNTLSPLFYILMLTILFATIFLGKEVNGSKSWFSIGSFAIQPAEFSKITTALMLSHVMSRYGFSLSNKKNALQAILVVLLPIILIVLEKETGSTLVYFGLIFVFYLSGLHGWILTLGAFAIVLFVVTLRFSPLTAICLAVIGEAIARSILKRKISSFFLSLPIAVLIYFMPELSRKVPFAFFKSLEMQIWALILLSPLLFYRLWEALRSKNKNRKYLFLSFIISLVVIFSVNFVFNNVLQPHQRARIENQLGITEDLQGVGYNVHQSQIAIGSGGLIGKGYLNGTQTKYNFVPEQSTDFIFCTVGEEWGFVGVFVIMIVYLTLIIRLLVLADKQEDYFVKVYGNCVAIIFAMHVFINIGMTMGMVPVVGIPLPFLSYGGSSMLSFTILLFIFIRLDNFTQNQR